MPRVLFRVKRNNSRAVRSFQKKVTKFLYTEEVLKSTSFRWRFNFADFAAWYQPAKVNRRPKFVIEANDA